MTVVGPPCAFCSSDEDVRFQIRVRQQRQTMWVIGPDGSPSAIIDPGVHWCCARCVAYWREKDARSFAQSVFGTFLDGFRQHLEDTYGEEAAEEVDEYLDAAERLRIINEAEKEYAEYMQGAIIMELK